MRGQSFFHFKRKDFMDRKKSDEWMGFGLLGLLGTIFLYEFWSEIVMVLVR